jgi:hypothetical protein
VCLVADDVVRRHRTGSCGRPLQSAQKRKEPPGNRAALSSGRIVPTEAKPSELSGCIVGAGNGSVKENPTVK